MRHEILLSIYLQFFICHRILLDKSTNSSLAIYFKLGVLGRANIIIYLAQKSRGTAYEIIWCTDPWVFLCLDFALYVRVGTTNYVYQRPNVKNIPLSSSHPRNVGIDTS